MNRLFLMIGSMLILITSQAWATMKLPPACNGFLNSSITGTENVFNNPKQAQANAWRRCNAIINAQQAAQFKAFKAKHKAWAASQNP